MEKLVKQIVRRHGGYREKDIMEHSHTIEKSETWNNEHQVLNILENILALTGTQAHHRCHQNP